MAEVLATFAALSSFLQVVDFAAKVGKYAQKIITSEHNAQDDDIRTAELAQELRSLTEDPPTSHDVDLDCADQDVATLSRLRQRCHNEVDELLEKLQSLKISSSSRGLKRARDGTKKAIKGVWNRQDIDKRRQHLQELNGQLITALLQSFLPKLDEQAKEALILLRRISDDNDLDDVGKLNKLDGLEYVARKVQILNRRILQSLAFAEISAREENIAQAYSETYHWALKEKSHGFSSWLRYGSGIFWINGKAGSGKSTLMKFLCRCEETHQLLRDWSGSRDLVFANFYFWYLGTSMQKSTEGLARSILHQVLTEQIELAPIAFPERYADIVRQKDKLNMRPTHQELVDALRRVAQHEPEARSRKKFCFFIDGLDEYHGNQLELVGLLRDLAHNPNVKLCVSSRPWNAFHNAFDGKVPTLKLEDLSRPDMLLYVNGKIETACRQLEGSDAERTSDIAKLVGSIVSRAEGVFLWIYLVVKSVLDGLAEGDDINFLRHRVQTFPSDLEDFFRNMLSRVDPVYKSQSSQALKLALERETEGGYAHQLSSWIDFWLIKQSPLGLEDASFAYTSKTQEIQIKRAEKMLLETRAFLSATCKDLLWLPRTESVDFDQQVQFLHRTVYDFLRHDSVHAMLDAQVPAHFKDLRVLHLLNLARWNYRTIYTTDGQHEYLLRTADMSIVRSHPELNKKFARQYEKMLLACGPHAYEQNRFYDRPDIFASLTAFGCNSYLRKLMDFCDKRTFVQPETMLIFAAAFGEHPINTFDLDVVDVNLIDALLSWSGLAFLNPDAGVLGKVLDLQCTRNAWSMFLRKSARTLRSLDITEETPGPSKSLRDDRECFWQFALMFLERGASMEEEFCDNPAPFDSEDHVHSRQTAARFLERHIPSRWIEESGYGELFSKPDKSV